MQPHPRQSRDAPPKGRGAQSVVGGCRGERSLRSSPRPPTASPPDHFLEDLDDLALPPPDQGLYGGGVYWMAAPDAASDLGTREDVEQRPPEHARRPAPANLLQERGVLQRGEVRVTQAARSR